MLMYCNINILASNMYVNTNCICRNFKDMFMWFVTSLNSKCQINKKIIFTVPTKCRT